MTKIRKNGFPKLYVAFTALLAILTFITARPELAAQEVTEEDYQRAERFLANHTSPLVQNAPSGFQWQHDDFLVYRNSIEGGTEFILANPATGDKDRAFDHLRMANALSVKLEEDVEPLDLPFRTFRFSDDRETITFFIRDTEYICSLDDYSIESRPVESEVGMNNESLSPDGTKAVYIRDHNLWMRDLETGEHTQLTFDGEEDYGYGINNAGWSRRDKPVVKWSPDSRRIATFQQDARGLKDMYLATTAVGHGNLHKWKYPLPGDSLIFRIERVVINLWAEPELVRLQMEPDLQRSTLTDHIADRAGDFLDVQWSRDSQHLSFVSSSRNNQVVQLRIADPDSGAVRDVLKEETETFFESGHNMISNWHVFPETDEVVWFSQRDNWGHLYLFDLQTGELTHQITSGDWNVMTVHHIDVENRHIFFTGSCREEGNPYFEYFYRVDMSGDNLTLLTPEQGHHQVQMAASGNYFSVSKSTPDTPPVTHIRDHNGEMVMLLEETDITQLEAAGWRPPIEFSVKARDGATDLWGLKYKPTNFDESVSYPILVYIYPGPQTGSVGSRAFRASRSDKQSLAELGFIVVEIDAMGTPGRSKAFHDAYYGNMGDNGLPDHITMIEQMVERHPYMDIDRVGIFGHSGGGFASTRALLEYPDFFHVAVSSAGNHDNRNYTDSWAEKWQGLLVEYEDEETGEKYTNYDNQANQLLAENLEGKLLITHGTMDTNVPHYGTYLVVDALIAANKDFDMIMFPNRGHGYYAEPYMMRARWDYFVRHLKGVEPPREYTFGEQ